jgi:hypothetical protein
MEGVMINQGTQFYLPILLDNVSQVLELFVVWHISSLLMGYWASLLNSLTLHTDHESYLPF